MTKEQLLKPRYKVISLYPGSDVDEGEIIELPNDKWFFAGKEKIYCAEDYFDAYPNIFQKLEWHEEREIKDLPKYVKGATISLSSYNKVMVANDWRFIESEIGDSGWWTVAGHHVNHLIPSDEPEYQEYQIKEAKQ